MTYTTCERHKPTPKMKKLIDNFYSAITPRKNASKIERLEARVLGVHANIAIVKGYMPHINSANQARAYSTIDNLLGVAELIAKEIDHAKLPARRRARV